MPDAQDKAVAKAVIKDEWATSDQVKECRQLQERLRNDGKIVPLVDILVQRNYITKSQRKKLVDDLHKKSSGDSFDSENMATCKYCGAKFNRKLLSPGTKLKCGSCGKHLEANSQKEPPQKLTLAIPSLGKKRKKKVSIPGYQILEQLGEDAVGTTYKACYKKGDNQLVVLKVFNDEAQANSKFMDSMVESVKQSTSLHIPNIRSNFGLGRCQGKKGKEIIYLVAEFIEGQSLRQILQQDIHITVSKAGKIIMRLAKVLQYANEEKMIHGDVAAHNVLISKEGKVILANLGVAKSVEKNLLRIAQLDNTAPLYVAPEVFSDPELIDQRSDIYSLGALYYQLLTSKHAFEGSSPFKVLDRLAQDIPIPPIQVFNPEVSMDISQIIEKMMAPDVDQRYQNYRELLHHLQDPSRVQKQSSRATAQHVIEEVTDSSAPEEYEEGEAEAKTLVMKSMPKKTPRRHRTQIPWAKIIFIGGLLALVGWGVYSKWLEAQKIEEAKENYFALRKYFKKHRNNPAKWEKLEKDFKSYKKRYADVPFSKEENVLDSIDSHLKKLEKIKKEMARNKVRGIIKSADILAKKHQYCAALEKIQKIPQELKTQKIQMIINRARKHINGRVHNLLRQAKRLAKRTNKTREYAAAIKKFEFWVSKFAEGAKSTKAFASHQKELQQHLERLRKEGAQYQVAMKKRRRETSMRIMQEITDKIAPMRQHHNYKSAKEVLQKVNRSQLLPEAVFEVDEMIKHLKRLQDAKRALIYNLNDSIDKRRLKPAIYHNNRTYTLGRISHSYLVLRPKKRLQWRQLSGIQLCSLVKGILEYTEPGDLYLFSFLCLEHKDFFLALQILQRIADSNENAQLQLENLRQRFSEKIDRLLKGIAVDGDLETSMGNALAIKSRYLLPGIPNIHDVENKIDMFFKENFANWYGKNSKIQAYETNFRKPKPFHELKKARIKVNFRQAQIAFLNSYLKFGSGMKWTLLAHNLIGIGGTCRFHNEKERFDIRLASEFKGERKTQYLLQINGDGIVKYTSYFPKYAAPKSQIKIPEMVNKWFIFAIYLTPNDIVWQINNQRLFSLAHPSWIKIREVAFWASTDRKGGVAIDNLYVADGMR